MHLLIVMLFFCGSSIGFAADDLAPIPNPRLPEAKGLLPDAPEEAVTCLLDRLKTVLREGQVVHWFKGPHLMPSARREPGRIYAGYKVVTRFPVADFLLRMTSADESGWSRYVYGDRIGAKASGLKRIAELFALKRDGSFGASTEIDLTPCERALSAGDR